MNTTTKHKVKIVSLIIVSFTLGAFFCYAFMWWQVYQKFNTVWTCQIFVGQLSIEEDQHCQQYKADKADGGVKYY